MSDFSLRFSPNISQLFSGVPFIDRFRLAAGANSTVVEISSDQIFDYPVAEIMCKTSLYKIRVDMMNSASLGISASGFAALPGKDGEFQSSVRQAASYAFKLDCKKINILTGDFDKRYDEDQHRQVFIENMTNISEMLEENDIIGLIEPIPAFQPRYFMNSFEKAVSCLEEINHPNIKLLLDIFNLQSLMDKSSSLIDEIKKYYPYAGHIQVAQYPGRYEPSYPGDIDYSKVFSLLRTLKYSGCIGLQFLPSCTTEGALKSMHSEFGIKLN